MKKSSEREFNFLIKKLSIINFDQSDSLIIFSRLLKTQKIKKIRLKFSSSKIKLHFAITYSIDIDKERFVKRKERILNLNY